MISYDLCFLQVMFLIIKIILEEYFNIFALWIRVILLTTSDSLVKIFRKMIWIFSELSLNHSEFHWLESLPSNWFTFKEWVILHQIYIK